ncbi:hypothetical protein [Acrocarpospora catenulata]|uniref:hypothetical protein n=1 Tax=Acrocarpospora catenulata TaxID=2836182 RepID=UPI001BDB1ED1|nr:hypothetical protein [Acrocarpospora catenulata]
MADPECGHVWRHMVGASMVEFGDRSGWRIGAGKLMPCFSHPHTTSRSGLSATGTRTERHALGAVEVPADHYWGAQTQRSLIHFNIGDDRMPKAVYHAYGYIKKAAAS